MLVIKNYIFPCIFCTIVFFSDLVAVQGQTKTGPQALAQLDDANTNSVINGTQDAILKEGKELKLECSFSINFEETNFRWQFEGKDINVTQKASATKKTKYVHPKTGSSILIIQNANASTDAGVYTCKVNHTSYDNSRNISVWSIPAFIKMPSSLNKVEGDSVFLTCRAYGLPLPEIWWGKESGVLEDNERIRTTNGTNNATLEIRDLVSEDRDNYICYASNNATNDTQQLVVLIRVKDKLAALWPFLGICAEVAILCTIIFIYEKRRSKDELEEEEPNQEEKTVSNSNQKDKDIRQRK